MCWKIPGISVTGIPEAGGADDKTGGADNSTGGADTHGGSTWTIAAAAALPLIALAVLLFSLSCGGSRSVTSGENAGTTAAQPFTISRISTDAAGNQADGRSWAPYICSDGSRAAFESDATNLVPEDTNNAHDIFLKDLGSGAIARISTDAAGNQANAGSFWVRLSSDGRYAVFQSDASNLTGAENDTNGAPDIFRKDTSTGATMLVSTDSDGVQGNGRSESPSVSADGRYVLFRSLADNLVADDTNATWDVFVKDTVTGTTTRVSTDSSGAQADKQSGFKYGSAISGNGNFAVFESDATNLVAEGDTNNQTDIFIKDLRSGATTLVSATVSGAQALNGPSLFPGISAAGGYVSFWSLADNLVSGDTNGIEDIFVKNMATGDIALATADADGVQANNGGYDQAISYNGRYVVFSSNSTNLAALGTGGIYNIYLKDMQTGAVSLLSINAAGDPGDDWSDAPSLSGDGRRVVHESNAANLVPDDTNGVPDIFFEQS